MSRREKLETIYNCVKEMNVAYIISCMYSLDGEVGRDGIHDNNIQKLEELEKVLKPVTEGLSEPKQSSNAPDGDDRSLEGWSDIILRKEKFR